MKKLTWNDYQLAQNRDDFESLDKETLEALSVVCPPPIKNEVAQGLYDSSQRRILRRLAQFEDEEKKKRTNWPMVSTLIALAVFCAAVIWKLAEVTTR